MENVVDYLLSGGVTSLDHQDRIPMVSTTVYTIIHWTRPIVNHDINYVVAMIH